MNKSQIWVDDSFLTLQHHAKQSGNLIELNNQMRIKASESTVSWIRNIVDERVITKLREDNNYDVQIFNSPKELQDAIKLKDKNQHLGISRLTATYDWEYSSQSKPKDKDYWCVEIENCLEIKNLRNYLGLNNHKLLMKWVRPLRCKVLI